MVICGVYSDIVNFLIVTWDQKSKFEIFDWYDKKN